MDLLEGFFKFLKTHYLPLGKDAPTLLAVSGGLDSVVMTHLFHRAGLPFAVAHCNFQLRGPESDGDELFVEKMALNFGSTFFVKRFETKVYAQNNALSTQMAARELRYEWFRQIAEDNGFSYIATAHHLNDSVETMLLNVIRGSGFAGLSGIKPISSLDPQPLANIPTLIRPLLFADRKEILEFSRAHEITWREDSSNDSDEYARNFVRHHIVPRMEDLNSNFLHTVARSMERIGEAERNLAFLLRDFFNIGLSVDQLYIEKQKLAKLPSPQQVLRDFLKPYGFDAEQARQIAENIDHVGLELHSKKGFTALVDRDEILVSNLNNRPITNRPITNRPITSQPITIHEDDLMLSLPDGSRLFLMPGTSHESSVADHQSIIVDSQKLKFPLHLRHWQPGDSFQPLGMDGKSQKLQDFFTNQKLSRFEKEEVWLLVNGDEALVWVLGLRLDERFKIHSKTNKALKINWIK
ncbi:MAG: tRNA lysidine(34) synthetase TilS [Saprospiraceae bacterium]